MSRKGLALGFTVGLGIGAFIGLMCAPQPGENVRKELRKRIGECIFKARWQFMSPEERYVYFWRRERAQRRKAFERSVTG
jgi:hypothetical protein